MDPRTGEPDSGRGAATRREIDDFHDALERPPEERRAFVRSKHELDPEHADRLLRLIDAHERAQQGERDTFEFDAGPTARSLDPTPERIGPYRVLEVLGRGGMGVVYAAEQTEPLRRRVAIKVVRLGMDSSEVLARFEAERQALAMMDHPGVARVFDAGVTERGRPYFVMELVKGLSLTDYCAQQRLSLRERLGLFVKVCEAVQHAHQKGIIHRDLKPSNVLVTAGEVRPLPKIIDFGVAKATGGRLTERTLFTAHGRLIGTLEYMSPEQAGMTGLDVDTRTDVYSLGVVLYELVTGVLPFDFEALRSGSYAEILRTIREVDPPRPSARCTALERSGGSARRIAPARGRSVRGELDWIVMRAMAKDRTRRYGTASALGEDVERHLTDRPVSAGPPSVAYTLEKFVKRHRFAAFLFALAVLSGAAGSLGLAVGLVRARSAEALAERRAETSQAAASFLQDVLFQADPEFVGGSPTWLEVIASAETSIEEDLGAFPEVEASVRESLGVAYRRRSMFAEAEPHLLRSLELRRELSGELHPDTASALIALANLRSEYGGRLDEARELLARAAAAYEANGWTGTAAEAWLQLDVGLVALDADHLAEAERAFVRCRDLLALHRGPEHPDLSRPLRGLALVALRRGDAPRAEALARDAVALCEGEGARYIGARARLVFAQVLTERGRFEEAGGSLTKAGDLFEQTVGTRHVRIAEFDAALSEWLRRQGNAADAEGIAIRCADLRRVLLDPQHWQILEARLLHLSIRIDLGDLDGVEPELSDVERSVVRRLGPDHPLRLRVTAARLECAVARGDGAAQRELAEQLLSSTDSRAARLSREDGG